MGNFENAVKSTPDIQNGYRKGLQALGANSKYVSATDNSQIALYLFKPVNLGKGFCVNSGKVYFIYGN